MLARISSAIRCYRLNLHCCDVWEIAKTLVDSRDGVLWQQIAYLFVGNRTKLCLGTPYSSNSLKVDDVRKNCREYLRIL